MHAHTTRPLPPFTHSYLSCSSILLDLGVSANKALVGGMGLGIAFPLLFSQGLMRLPVHPFLAPVILLQSEPHQDLALTSPTDTYKPGAQDLGTLTSATINMG